MKKIFALLLVVLLICSIAFTGCEKNNDQNNSNNNNQNSSNKNDNNNNNNTKNNKDDKTNSKNNEDTNSTSNFNESGLPVFNEPVTYTVLARTPGLAKKSLAEKEVWQNRSNETNVMIDWEEVPASGYAEKVNIVVQSGDYPDALYPGWIPNALFTQAIDAGHIIAISDYSQYTPNLNIATKAYADYMGALIYQKDGKLYGYPKFSDAAFANVRFPLFMNKQWLDNLGLEVPKTTDDYYKVLKAFKENDANGNGDTNDEIPASFGAENYLDLFGAWDVQAPVHGRAMYCGVDDNENVYLIPEHEGFKEGINYFHKLYVEGLLDPESLTQKVGDLNAKIENEIPIVGSYNEWMPQQTNREQYIAIEPLEGPDGFKKQTYMDMGGSQANNGIVIFSNCEQPEGLIRFVDWCLDGKNAIETQYGKEGVAWASDEATKTWFLTPENLKELGVSLEEYKQTEGTQNGFLFHDITEVTGYQFVATEGSDIAKKDEWSKMYSPYFFAHTMPRANPFKPTTDRDEELGFIWTDLEQYIKIFTVDSIINGLSNEDWDKHLDKLSSLRYEEIVEYQQERYDLLKEN